MGLTFTAGTSASAPKIAPDIYDAAFKGVRADELENSQFDSEVFIWSFALLEEGGEPLYDEGEPVILDKVTSRSTNTKSKTTPGAVKVLKALMTDAEYTRFEAEEPIDADALLGRKVQVQVIRKENGWPGIEAILPARKPRGGK